MVIGPTPPGTGVYALAIFSILSRSICPQFSGGYPASLTISIGLAFVQFLFALFTSKVNTSIANVNSYIIEFFDDSLAFLLFKTEEKPFPFKNNSYEEEVVIEADEIEESSEQSEN